jgi:hypothetical protein
MRRWSVSTTHVHPIGRRGMYTSARAKLSVVTVAIGALVISTTFGLASLPTCPIWSSWQNLGTDYGFHANGQPGLATLNGKLILTWGDAGDDYLHAAVSSDGANWTGETLVGAPQVYSSVKNPAPPPWASGGVNMTASAACGYVYVAYTDPSGDEIYGARSKDGVNWDDGHPIWTEPDGWLTSAPALYADPSGVIRFAAPHQDGAAYQPNGGSRGPILTYVYNMQMGQFNCDFGNITLTGTCFFYEKSTGTCQDSSINPDEALEYDEGYVDYELGETGFNISGPWSPLWIRADGVELRAEARGNPLGNVSPNMYYSLNQGAYHEVGAGNWTNNGLGGAVNPADGTPFLVTTCRQFNSDTCGGTPWINFFNLRTGYICNTSPNGDWSISMPAMTFYNGKIWLAWRGGWEDDPGNVVVASISPSSL